MVRRGRVRLGFNTKGFEAAAYEFEKKYIQQVKNIVQATGAVLHAEATARAPVDLGNLKKSITATPSNKGLTVTIIVGASYGIFQELGTGIFAKYGNGRKDQWTYYSARLGRWVTTRGNEPQPYFFPAVARAKDYFERNLNRIG